MDTDKHDKVIKGLSIHGNDAGIPNQCEVFGCPYYEGTAWCNHELASDALDLLRHLIPRLLTLNEVATILDRPVWLERKVTLLDKTTVWISGTWALVMDDMETAEIRPVTLATSFGIEKWDTDSYYIEWRCWSNEPSEENRKSAEWSVAQ